MSNRMCEAVICSGVVVLLAVDQIELARTGLVLRAAWHRTRGRPVLELSTMRSCASKRSTSSRSRIAFSGVSAILALARLRRERLLHQHARSADRLTRRALLRETRADVR